MGYFETIPMELVFTLKFFQLLTLDVSRSAYIPEKRRAA